MSPSVQPAVAVLTRCCKVSVVPRAVPPGGMILWDPTSEVEVPDLTIPYAIPFAVLSGNM